MKRFFNYIADQEEKYIDYNLLSTEILLPSGDVLNFFNKYRDLYNFWIDALLENINRDKIISQQARFLKDLMDGYSVYKNIEKTKRGVSYKAEDLYLKLLGNPNKTVDDILFKKSKDEHNKDVYSQAITLFKLREIIFKKLVKKGIIKSDTVQSGIDSYEETIGERTKLRRQELDEIERKEQNINNDLFKKYFKYKSPSNMHKELNKTENIEINQIRVNLIKSSLIDLKKDIKTNKRQIKLKR